MSHTLLIASHNQGKVHELQALVAPLGFAVRSAAEANLPEPEETGDSFEANAALKAEAAAAQSGLWCLADDSGLSVDALDGAPGIYSARWAGEHKDFTLAMERVRQELAAKGLNPEGQRARFVCVLALAIPQAETLFFRGECEGCLTFPPRGSHGFGYDPIFVPDTSENPENLTFAELAAAFKQAISHRARAFALFTDHLRAQAA